MLLIAFLWPNTLLVTTLVVLIVSVFLPYFLFRRQRLVVLLPVILATILWRVYEFRLVQLAPVGDPLIRIDLLVICPVLLLSWASAVAALITQSMNSPSAGGNDRDS